MKLRREFNIHPKMIVVKLSSLAVTHIDGGIDLKKIRVIVSDLHKLMEIGIKPVIVSSGAVNAGKPYLRKNSAKQTEISYLQACSCIGQPILMSSFQKELGKYNLICAQQLVTHEDFKNKKRSHNVKSSLKALVTSGIIPIINENDGVSFDEITVGDNDQLSAMITELIGAQALILLTQARGLFDRDPLEKGAQLIPFVKFDNELKSIKTKTKTMTGRGGMKTKILAARKLTPLGIPVVVSSFEIKKPIINALTNSSTGSFFEADSQAVKKDKESWILPRVKLGVGIIIDKGARDALLKNASLLPVGVIGIEGSFNRGESIPIYFQKKIVAYGITEYSSRDISKIKGINTKDLGEVLKHIISKVVIHKNNLILKRN